jgi:diacylglycerol O-acyltransferase
VTRVTLSNIDAAMLHLEDPTNLMMITGVMVFTAPIDFERLKATIQVRLLSMDRFRQRVAWPRLGLGQPYWEDDPDFDLSYHLQRATLPAPGDQAALQDVVSLLASQPLDLARPLWQFQLVENYAKCCAVVLRFHHCLADGMALNHVILSLTDPEPDAPWPVVQVERPPRADRDRPGIGAWPSRRGREAAGRLLREGFEVAVQPSRMRDLGRTGRDAAATLGRFLFHEPDPKTVLQGELGVTKRAAWSQPVPLDEVKSIGRRLGGTVNDVLMTAVAGALRHYLEARGDPVDRLTIRAAVPVNMREPGREGELGNRVGAVFVTLPLSIADPVCRLGEVVRLMAHRKDSLEGPVFFSLLHLLGQAPPRIANTLICTFSTRASVVMTNVRGPEARLYLAGSPMEALLPWAPTTGRMGVAVSILSYAGVVWLGLLTDQGLVPDPERILDAFHAEFQVLRARAELEEEKPGAGS